jgi:hypothetical protein
MSGFTAVEAVLATTTGSTAVAASAALLAPADPNPLALKLMTIEVSDCLLSVLLLVEVHETECTLIIYYLKHFYLEPDLTGPNVAEEFLELCGILVVGDVPYEQTHLLCSF